MSNPNYIGIKHKSTCYYVYCHDGCQLSENGRILYENYNTVERVNKLLAKGDMSYLGKTLEESSFYKDWKDRRHRRSGTWSVNEYNRPRAADNNASCYLWDGQQWLYSPENDSVWIPLSAVFQHQLTWC